MCPGDAVVPIRATDSPGPLKPEFQSSNVPPLRMRLVEGIRAFLLWSDDFLPVELLTDPEATRHARLIVRFGFLGAASGLAFTLFYALIGHLWGAGVVAVSSLGFLAAPFVLRTGVPYLRVGNLLTGTMWFGFTVLCFLEGGHDGHAIAWLVTVPLCALLLVCSRAAWGWALASLASAAVVIALDFAGIHLPPTYAERWEPVVSAAGYLTLIVFLFLLGVIFENGRLKAQRKMQEALLRLESSNAQLQLLNEEKTEFLGIAAHDLKNPLTAIIGNAELLAMTQDAADIPQTCEGIIKASSRMRSLITDLLDANAIEEGRHTSRIGRCDLNALVEESLGHNRDTASRKGIRLQLETASAVFVEADPGAVTQILDNLLSNAVKYSPPSSEVWVRMSSSGGQGAVSVVDRGPGLTPEDQKKLFRKYTRLSAKPTAGESSTGLGLSIVKRLAEAMKGTVECRSTPGDGATFTVRLPLWRGPG